MRPSHGGVQFFDYVEERQGFDHDNASAAAWNSGSTAAATTDTSTVANGASGKAAGGRPAKLGESTGPATKAGPTTVTISAPTAPGNGIAAWGIMVPKS
jgi:hypothetical protein